MEKKNSKYFLALEKRNYVNKFISSLEIDGHIVKDSNKISKPNQNIIKIYILKS